MSSPRKDARWQLAYDMLELVEVDPHEMATDPTQFGTFQRLLVAADVLLTLNPEKVDEFAERWNKEEKP